MSETEAVILAEGHQPFQTRQKALDCIAAKELSADEWVPHKYGAIDGNPAWALINVSQSAIDTMLEPPATAAASQPSRPTGYQRIRIQPKRDQHEITDVPVGVNGRIILCQRATEIILPDPYIEVLRNAYQHEWEEVDGQSRKSPRRVLQFPFDSLGVSTEAEYRAALAAGNKRQAEDLARIGVEQPTTDGRGKRAPEVVPTPAPAMATV